jgi:hypothetical protein
MFLSSSTFCFFDFTAASNDSELLTLRKLGFLNDSTISRICHISLAVYFFFLFDQKGNEVKAKRIALPFGKSIGN